MPSFDKLLASYPESAPVPAEDVANSFASSGQVLVVLDDDPTGTQSVADMPVLTDWTVDDFLWAFDLRLNDAPTTAVYVLTNTRSLDPDEAAERNRQVVSAALTAAEKRGINVTFVSRSDSTLRGHYPLETDVIADTMTSLGERPIDGVVFVPAFPDAGRITIGGEHYLLNENELTAVADSEFANDATFGFSSSYLPQYIAEKSAGRFRTVDSIVLDLGIIRGGANAIAEAIQPTTNSRPIIADIVTEDDLRALSLGLTEAERRGKSLLYRVGPPFVRGRTGQDVRRPLTSEEIFTDAPRGRNGGLIVVGSHVGLTTRQLDTLTTAHPNARTIEIDVNRVLSHHMRQRYIEEIVASVHDALDTGDVVLHTSRTLVKTEDAAKNLSIARTISSAVVQVVNQTVKQSPPRFVIAKGGITSSDVASHGLEIRRAIVRGPMLPGIVSLWAPNEGPATGIPFVVFAGNVGTDDSLLRVVQTLSVHCRL